MGTARNKMADDAKARSKVYGLLAAIFRAEPSEEFIKELKTAVLSDILSDMGVSLGDEFYKNSSSLLTEGLAVEYTRLFIGPGSHISPYESVFVDVDGSEGGLWGEKTVEVKKFIETAGFDYQPEFSGLPDHIGAELEFMQKLGETEARLRSEGEAERADWCLGVQKKFVDEHLSKWAPDFCDTVIEKAEMPFYAEMAKVMRSFIEFECDSLAASETNSVPLPQRAEESSANVRDQNSMGPRPEPQ